MTDGAWAYTRNRSLAALLDSRGIQHLVTRPYRPQTNGKVCVSGSLPSPAWAARLTRILAA